MEEKVVMRSPFLCWITFLLLEDLTNMFVFRIDKSTLFQVNANINNSITLKQCNKAQFLEISMPTGTTRKVVGNSEVGGVGVPVGGRGGDISWNNKVETKVQTRTHLRHSVL